jgi:translation initiation factor IF-3
MRAAPEREPAGPRMNEDVRVPEVRLIDETGQNVGVVATADALARAVQVGLDLVEISPDAAPPVAKILDYGKFKYQEQKKAAEARKRQKVVEIKEIKMRPSIDDHD